jgi:hypothetical protein
MWLAFLRQNGAPIHTITVNEKTLGSCDRASLT